MANITTSWVQQHPSYLEPEILLPYQQASGAFDLLGEGGPRVRLGTEDLQVYLKKFDIRTRTQAGQSASNNLPSVSVSAEMKSTPTYLVRARAEYDHHDTSSFSQWGASIVDAQRFGMRQGIFQQLRIMLLYGNQPQNGEGLLNTNGATAVPLPADSNGNTTVVTYDNGQMATFLLGQLGSILTRTMQSGQAQRFVILAPQRVLNAWELQDIVQVVQYQREGAGTAATAAVVQLQAGFAGYQVEYVFDDTLIGKGVGGTDAVIITVPEVKKPDGGKINTNEFAKLSPGLQACNLMYMDMPAPREIPTPLAGGAIDIVSELRATCGWGVRPEATTIISMRYQ